MAGDWIKMRADLQTHPKVVRIACALDADGLRVIGALHAVWCLFDAHSEDGQLDGYSPKVIDKIIGWEGFTKQMSAVEWLEITAQGVCVPRFDSHNGRSAKRRAQEADRTHSVRKEYASNAYEKRTREEKRRVDKEDGARAPSIPPGDTLSEEAEFAKLWNACEATSKIRVAISNDLLTAFRESWNHPDWKPVLLAALERLKQPLTDGGKMSLKLFLKQSTLTDLANGTYSALAKLKPAERKARPLTKEECENYRGDEP